eukprot:XP_025014006.1 uncharacterized protein LOC112535599 [Ricinus communis]
MPHFINKNQSAIIAGRLITDNILLCHESVHYLKFQKSRSKEGMALKMDMAKAYNKLEWAYIKHMLMAFRFSEVWIKWVVACVTSVTYSININGALEGFIIPFRGIRQSDPLSPLIFLLCADGLSHMCAKAQGQNRLKGIPVARGNPSVNHLLFVDNSMSFSECTISAAQTLNNILLSYARASGQEMNPDKSAIYFSPNTLLILKAHIAGIFQIRKNDRLDRYLDLPAIIDKTKKKTFSELISKIRSKVQGWKEKLLSPGRKEIFIKAIASVALVFSMCFFDPEKMHCSKSTGVLGFKDMHGFNIALLAKQAWRLFQYPSSLLARVLKDMEADSVRINFDAGCRSHSARGSIGFVARNLQGDFLGSNGKTLLIFNGVFLKVNKAIVNMLHRVEPYVTYRYHNLKSVKELIYKRGYGKVNQQRIALTNNSIIEQVLGKHGIICMKDLIHKILIVGPHFKEANNFLWPFQLKAPLEGLTKKRNHYVKGGDAGNCEDYINELIRRMN